MSIYRLVEVKSFPWVNWFSWDNYFYQSGITFNVIGLIILLLWLI